MAVHTDYVYRQQDGAVFADRAFVIFLARIAQSTEKMVIAGRLDPEPGRSHYELAPEIEFLALPHYKSLLNPLSVLGAVLGSLRRFWRALDDVDVVWLLGPYLTSLVFYVLAVARGKTVVLGVRQDLPEYARRRHPERRWTHAAAELLDASYRLLARRNPVVVVGPDLRRRYRRSPRLLEIAVSLVEQRDVVPLESALARSYDGELRMISVGRVEGEKNPLLLADILARLHERDHRWRLSVCGEGPMLGELRSRLERLGVEQFADLRGYVAIDAGLRDVYVSSHVLLHVSWTEGLPQVLFEAYAAGLPVVATAVGGVPESVGDAALLVEPGDAVGAADALTRIAEDAKLRSELIEAGSALVKEHTVERETARVVEFIARAIEGR